MKSHQFGAPVANFLMQHDITALVRQVWEVEKCLEVVKLALNARRPGARMAAAMEIEGNLSRIWGNPCDLRDLEASPPIKTIENH